MKITTWNVNGIRAREAQVLDWVRREQPDVLCLQEIKASPDQVPQALCAMDGYWCYWHGHKGYSGVGLHLRKAAFPDAPRFSHPEFDHEQRIVVAQAEDLRIASVYVPNGGKDFPAKVRFLDALTQFVASTHQEGLRLVLCGDLNVARAEVDVHPRLRKPQEIGQTEGERTLFAQLLDQGLVDVGRELAPEDDRLFTWWAPWRNLRERNMGWRIDYVLVSEALRPLVSSCQSLREFGTSDHAPVTVTFSRPLVKTAPVDVAPAPPSGQLSLELG